MATLYKRPGSFVQETTLAQRIVAQNNGEAVGAFAGITERGVTSAPQYVGSWADYTTQFGGFNDPNGTSLPLAHAIYQFFSNSGRGCYIQRVVGAGASSTSLTLTDKTGSNNVLTVTAISAGSWGSKLSVYVENTAITVALPTSSTGYSATSTIATINTSTPHGLVPGQSVYVNIPSGTGTGLTGKRVVATVVDSDTFTFAYTGGVITAANAASGSYISPLPETFNLSVYYGGTTDGYLKERYTDLTMDPASDRYAVDFVNTASQWVTLSLPGSYSNPDLRAPKTPDTGLPQTLTGSSLDGSAVTSAELIAAADAFDTVLVNLVFNIPDATGLSSTNHRDVVNAYVSKADARGDSFVVIDTPASLTTANALSWVVGITPKSGNSAVYYPWVKVPNPASSGNAALRTMPPGGAVVGYMLANDAVNGTQKAPAGVAASLRNVVATESNLTSANLDSLNSNTYPINAIRPVPGSGLCIMGARTLSGSRTDRYINARRTLLRVKKRISDLTQFGVFENNNSYLWDQITTICIAYLNEIWQAGALKGNIPSEAFYVICDATNNTEESIAEGELNVEVGVALNTPAEFVVIKIGQFQGSTTVRVEE